MEKKAYLDWIRVVAVFLVLYGHLATAASFVTQEATIFSDKYELPINNAESHKAYILDTIFSRFGTGLAVIGVVLFLLLSGYLTAMTREKHKNGFLMNRIIRIYPALIISVIVCGIIAAIMGVKYSLFQYIANCLLLYPCMGFGATIGTLWTLVVELIFYCIVQHFATLNFKNIVIIDGVILFFVIAQAITKCGSYSLIYSLKFVPIILFGAMMYEINNIKGIKKYFELVLVAFLTYLILYIAITYTYTSDGYYKCPASYIFALCIWGIFYLFYKFGIKVCAAVNKIINFIVSISYFVYLLQLNIGFTVMYFLREFGVGPYINIVCGVLATFAVSAILHYLCEKPIQKILKQYINKKMGESDCVLEAK